MKYRRNQNVGLFDKENTLQELLENGNPYFKIHPYEKEEEIYGVIDEILK